MGVISNLRQAILDSKVSLLSISKKSDISRGFLYSILYERITSIRYDKLCRICDAIDVDVNSILKAE